MTWTYFREEHGDLVYRERLSAWARVLVGGFGLVLLVLSVAVAWNDGGRSPGFVALAVAALLLAGLFVYMASIGVRQLRFDAADRCVHVETHGPFGRRQRLIAYDRVSSVTVGLRKGLDDPDYFVIELDIADQPRLELGHFQTRDAADQWRQRLQDEVQRG